MVPTGALTIFKPVSIGANFEEGRFSVATIFAAMNLQQSSSFVEAGSLLGQVFTSGIILLVNSNSNSILDFFLGGAAAKESLVFVQSKWQQHLWFLHFCPWEWGLVGLSLGLKASVQI